MVVVACIGDFVVSSLNQLDLMQQVLHTRTVLAMKVSRRALRITCLEFSIKLCKFGNRLAIYSIVMT